MTGCSEISEMKLRQVFAMLNPGGAVTMIFHAQDKAEASETRSGMKAVGFDEVESKREDGMLKLLGQKGSRKRSSSKSRSRSGSMVDHAVENNAAIALVDDGRPKPQQKHIDALLSDPSDKKKRQFDDVFGAGAADEIIDSSKPKPQQKHINALLADPSERKKKQFDTVFGAGAADKVLDASKPEPQQKHIDALLSDPSDKKCKQFDQVFGAGKAAQILAAQEEESPAPEP